MSLPSFQVVASFSVCVPLPFKTNFSPWLLWESLLCAQDSMLNFPGSRAHCCLHCLLPAVWTCWARNSSQQRCSFSLLKNKTLYLMCSLSAPSLERLRAASPALYMFHACYFKCDSWDKREMWISNRSNEGKNTGKVRRVVCYKAVTFSLSLTDPEPVQWFKAFLELHPNSNIRNFCGWSLRRLLFFIMKLLWLQGSMTACPSSPTNLFYLLKVRARTFKLNSLNNNFWCFLRTLNRKEKRRSKKSWYCYL